MQGNQYQIDKEPIMQIPVFDTTKDSIKKEIIKNVDLIIKLNKEKQEARLETQTDELQAHIHHCEEKINEMVYQLYELTEEEIKIVEGV